MKLLNLFIILLYTTNIAHSLDFDCKNTDQSKVECILNIHGLNVIDIFPLDNPKRMVFDFKNTNSPSFNKVNSKLVQGLNNIRIGKHPDKVRVVLDIKEDTFNEIKWDQNDSQIIFILLKSSIDNNIAIREEPEQLDEKESEEIEEQEVVKGPLPESTPEKLVNKETEIFEEDEKKTSLKSVEKQVVPIHIEKNQELNKIEFVKDNNGKSNQIKFTMKKVPEFNMAKMSNRTYRIKIPKAGLAQGLEALPYFPPHDIPKLVYIQPEEKNDNLYIEIGVERGARLRAIADNNHLMVTVLE